MIRVRQVKINIEDNTTLNIKKEIAHKLKIKDSDILDIKINKESIDARDKNNLKYIYEVDVKLKDESKIKRSIDIFDTPDEEYRFEFTGKERLIEKIVVVGSGPAGLFATYMLVTNGYPVLLIERGEKVEDRIKTVQRFWNDAILNENSNIQFGEGGAGTFSDGKLNTLKKDKFNRQKKVFEIFVENGAPKEILITNKPHIGTDILRQVIINMRNKIIEYGGEIRYNTCLTDLIIKDNEIKEIVVNDNETIKTNNLVLALGNGARDTFQMLLDRNLNITSKPFAVGIRIQHPQKLIDKAQYGTNNFNLPPSSYKLTYTSSNKRGVYTFCMCPGGYVINAMSEKERLVINGMSNYKRDSLNANSAIIVTISKNDFGSNPLDGIEYQRKLESKAYKIGNGHIPIQTYKGYKENKVFALGNIKPIFKGKYKLSNINEIFPDYINESLKEAIDYFGSKIKDFNSDDAIIAAVESRTSSPIRIERDELLESNIKGIYPIGEGSGYAGGITTSAIDGIKLFEVIISKYKLK